MRVRSLAFGALVATATILAAAGTADAATPSHTAPSDIHYCYGPNGTVWGGDSSVFPPGFDCDVPVARSGRN